MLSSVKIGPFIYEITQVKDLHDFEGNTKVDLWGHAKTGETKIELLDTLSNQRQIQVLWHELLHAILTQTGHDEHNEQHLDALSTGIIQLLRDNVELTVLTSSNPFGDAEAMKAQLARENNHV